MSDRLELKVLFTAVDKFVRPVKAITDTAREATKALKSNSDRISEFNSTIGKIDAFKRVEKDAAVTANTIKSTTAKIEALRAEIAKSGAPTEVQAKRLKDLDEKSAALAETSEKLRRRHIDLSAALKQSKIDTSDLATARDQLSSASADATLNSRRLEDALDAENRKMRRLNDANAELLKMRERAGKLRSAGTSMMIGGGAMLAAEMVPIKAFAEAEDSATQLRVALMKSGGAVSEEFVEINALAERLGNRLPGTTSDFQNMMTMLVRQGMPAKTILGGLGEATALLGVQLKMPMEASAEFAAKLQDATRTSEKDMLGLMDVIQRTFYLGVDQNNMLEAFKGLGPVMDMIKNKGLEGTKALAPFVVMMDQAGMRGESAGNAIRKVVSRSLNVGNIRAVMGDLKKAKGIDLNLDFTNGKGEFGGIDRMMAELSKLKRFDTVTRLSILKDIYGDDKETNEVLSKIIEQGKDGYNEVIAKMAAQASLQERVNTQLGTLKNLWDAASGTFTNALVAFGEAIAPQLKSLTEWIGSTAEATQRWAREHPELSKALMLTVGGVGTLLVTLGGLSLTASAILGPFAMASFVFATLGASGFSAMEMLGRGFSIVTKGIGLIGRALLMNPIGLIITGIAVAAFLIYKYWEPIKAFFSDLWANIKDGMSAAWDWIRGKIGDFVVFWKPALEFVQTLPDRMQAIGGQMIDGMISGISSRWDALKTAVTDIGGKSVDWLKDKLDMHSPSRVFAELGGYTVQGFEKGMLANVDGPLGAISMLSKRLAAIGAGVVISGAAAAGNVAIDTRPAMSGQAGVQHSASGGDTFIFHINAAPGMDENALARAVRNEFERQRNAEASRRRSRLRDPE